MKFKKYRKNQKLYQKIGERRVGKEPVDTWILKKKIWEKKGKIIQLHDENVTGVAEDSCVQLGAGNR